MPSNPENDKAEMNPKKFDPDWAGLVESLQQDRDRWRECAIEMAALCVRIQGWKEVKEALRKFNDLENQLCNAVKFINKYPGASMKEAKELADWKKRRDAEATPDR